MKTQPQRPLEEDLKDTALEIAANCFGFAAIENGLESTFSEEETKAYYGKVVNKIYTYLYYNFKCGPEEDLPCFLEMVALNHTRDFNRPELDKDMLAAVENIKKSRGKSA